MQSCAADAATVGCLDCLTCPVLGSTDWESEASHVAFIKSPQYGPFMAGVREVFDLEVAAPVMSTSATRIAPLARSIY